ncbi:unnamed protein product, partial [Rotaria sp. Silwood1]
QIGTTMVHIVLISIQLFSMKKIGKKPQQVDMSFGDYGCCTYVITAVGGGYEWQYTTSTFAVYACDGQAGYGCKGKEPCGA